MLMRITVNGVELFYQKTGTGEPIILLHGNGEDHHIFDKLTAKLRSGFTVYAIDSRNHGKSGRTGVYSYDVMAEDIFCFLHALRLEKVNIAGFSDGAIVSLILAINHREALKKMALLGVNLKPSDFTEKSYHFVKTTYEKTKDPLFKLMLEQPDIELADVRAVEIPTLVVAAEHDIYRPELFAELTGALPSAELMIMNGHNHDSYIVNQDLLYSDFLRFFRNNA